MPAAVKRIESGIYLLYLGETVNEDDIAEATKRYAQAARNDNSANDYIVLIEALEVNNPLRAARMLLRQIDPAISRCIVVGSSHTGMIFAERLSQKLHQGVVDVRPHQEAAIMQAKFLRGTESQPVELTCDYL